MRVLHPAKGPVELQHLEVIIVADGANLLRQRGTESKGKEGQRSFRP